MKYRISGVDPDTGESIELVVEADTPSEAEGKARKRGVDVRKLDLVSAGGGGGGGAVASGASGAGVGAGMFGEETAGPLGPEQDIWWGRPSQWTNFRAFVLCALIIPIPWAIWRWLVVRTTKFTLTTQRIRKEWGVFSRHREEIEIYRVKDFSASQSFPQRLVGVGTIRLVTSDRTTPELVMPSLREHLEVHDVIRKQTEAMRRARNVREIDME